MNICKYAKYESISCLVNQGSWEAIFRVTDEINSMQGGVEVYST